MAHAEARVTTPNPQILANLTLVRLVDLRLISQSPSAPENMAPPGPAHASKRPPQLRTAQSDPLVASHPPPGRSSKPAPSAPPWPCPPRSASRYTPKTHQFSRGTPPTPP